MQISLTLDSWEMKIYAKGKILVQNSSNAII